jgi:hypothetical protein
MSGSVYQKHVDEAKEEQRLMGGTQWHEIVEHARNREGQIRMKDLALISGLHYLKTIFHTVQIMNHEANEFNEVCKSMEDALSVSKGEES